MLEDEQSREIYSKRLNYLVLDDFRVFREIVDKYMSDYGQGKKHNLDDFLSKLPEGREFILFGAGKYGQSLLCFLDQDERFAGFCSSTGSRQERGCAGYPVMSPAELLSRKDLSVVISASDAPKFEIMQILKAGGYPAELIFDGYSHYMNSIRDAQQYFSPDFIRYDDNEVFVDVGCLDLGSSLILREHCKNLKKVFAFEPDPQNLKQCVARKEETGFSEATILPYGAWSERTTLSFQAGLMGSSGVCETGEGSYSINVVPIDEVVGGEDRVTFLKMDIEGAELEALKGARKIILRDKPKLAICIYHKPEDMWEIPLYIKRLVPEYRMYIRHHSTGPDETVLYAVMP